MVLCGTSFGFFQDPLPNVGSILPCLKIMLFATTMRPQPCGPAVFCAGVGMVVDPGCVVHQDTECQSPSPVAFH